MPTACSTALRRDHRWVGRERRGVHPREQRLAGYQSVVIRPPTLKNSRKNTPLEHCGTAALTGDGPATSALAALNSVHSPRYEQPIRPTSPFEPSSSWAAYWTSSAPSRCWRGDRNSSEPPDRPVPRASTISEM